MLAQGCKRQIGPRHGKMMMMIMVVVVVVVMMVVAMMMMMTMTMTNLAVHQTVFTCLAMQ
jgi:flagellar basal body-associated protein FliL